MENKKEYGIFENVQFLDEGAGAVIFGLLALPYIIAGSVIIGMSIDSKLDKNRYENNKKKINRMLIKLSKSDKDIAKFKADMGAVKFIDAVHLLRAIGKNIGDRETNILKTRSTKCAIIYDKNENIIAYAMLDMDNNKCAYNIMNTSYRSNEHIKYYIMATLEDKLNIVGEGINWFDIKLKKVKHTHNFSHDGENTALIVSKAEYGASINAYNSLVEKLKAFIKASVKDCIIDYEDDRDGDFTRYIGFMNKYIYAAEKRNDSDAYDESWNKYANSFFKDMDNALKKFNQNNKTIIDKYGFKVVNDEDPDYSGYNVSIYHPKGYVVE